MIFEQLAGRLPHGLHRATMQILSVIRRRGFYLHITPSTAPVFTA